MNNTNLFRRLMALVLCAAMVCSLGVGAAAAADSSAVSYTKLDPSQVSASLTNTGAAVEEEQTQSHYSDTDLVRVTIVMEQPSTMAYMDMDLSAAVKSVQAAQYQLQLAANQALVTERISDEVLSGEKLDVVWNLTLVSNSISANVKFGDIDAISNTEGVSAVYLEKQYQPLEADVSNVIAQVTTGAASVQQDSGYTGAGTRIAIIDTGTDTDHQSFGEGAYLYALEQLAESKGVDADAYIASLDLLTQEEIESVLPQLHAAARYEGVTAEDLYESSKLPFNFNYVDESLDVTHDNDDMGEHGSHVAGIAAANSYVLTDGADYYDFDNDGDFDIDDAQALLDYAVKNETIYNVSMADVNGDGSVTAFDAHVLLDYLASADENGQFYGDAAAMVGVTGTAPEAQILTMKVFGANGGAYSSDYMAAVEDALVLGCDAVNLSLGEGNPGFSSAHESTDDDTAYVDGILESLESTGMVMCVAAGNSSSYTTYDNAYGLAYTDEGGMAITSSPATYTNAFSVASSDNVGYVAQSKTLFHSENGEVIPSILGVGGENHDLWTSLDPDCAGTTYEVVFLGDPTGLLTGAEQTDHTIYGASYEGLDLTGKIVLVARGDGVYFSAKHQGAAEAGAAAVLIYNNESGELNASIEGSTATIPCGTITMADAARIFNLCANEDGVFTCSVTVTSGVTAIVDWEQEPTMSTFSSWGSTGDLTIKPEITAPGGNIYSVNGLDKSGTAYEVMSGTSMATPHVSGLVALANQYIRETGLLETAKTVSKLDSLTERTLIQSLLMSTAVPMVASNGNAYPVRQQGAGLANIDHVVNAETFLMVDGLTDGKIKAELGDGVDGWSFGYSVYNLTGEAVTYDLDAAILTTDTVEADGYYLSAEEMVALGANVTFGGDVVDGKVTVPASGSTHVTVTIDITDEAVKNMEALGYTNGFYVEGFVYLNGENDAVSHSIPLLGWYGDWSDPSMFDSGSYIDAFFGTETRPGHIPSDAKNFMAWAPVGDDSGHYYTGNVYVSETTDESHYDPARNAISTDGEGSWEFYAIFPSLIRNAADVQFQIVDADTGKVFYVGDYEEMDDCMIASFYYPSYGDWYDTTSDYGIGCDWDYTDPETGLPVAEGTRLSFQLLCAPEYCVKEDGSVDWDALGDGCKLSFELTVDNTAPALAGEEPLTISADGKTLTYNVQDNNYIAAVILLDGSASSAIEFAYPDMDTEDKGAVYTGSFDLTDFAANHGNKAVIAVCDYAGNESYYALNLGGEGADYGDLVGFQYDFEYGINSWVSFSEGVSGNETQMFISDLEFVCAEYVNGFVFAETSTGALHGFRYADMLSNTLDLESTYIAQLDNVYQDLAYNYYDGKLYGLYTYTDYDGYPTSEIDTINLKGEYYDADMLTTVMPYQEDWVAQRGGVYGLTLAINDAGSVYLLGPSYDGDTEELTETAYLWKAEMEEDPKWGAMLGAFMKVGDTGLTMDYLQSMTWDHNTESLYWARFAPTGAFTTVSELVKVDPETAECTSVGTLVTETCALFAPLTAETAAKEEHANVPAMDSSVVGRPLIRDDVVTMNVGSVKTLSYDLDPWYTDHKDVIWSSDNTDVLTVDDHGTITAIAEGTAIVTASAKDDPTLTDTCTVQVSALDLKLEGVISAQTAGLGNVTGVSTYEFNMTDGIPTFGTVNAITASEELNYGLSLAISASGRGSIWACENGNTGMVYEIDAATGNVKDVLKPIDGDMLFGITYNETTDAFTGIMNMYLYVDQPFTHWAEEQMINSSDEELRAFNWRRVNMLPYLIESNTGFVTGEDGNGASSEIVFCGITSIDGGVKDSYGETYYYDTYKDYLGNGAWSGMVNYQPTQTLVLLDNVGRLWYVDEIAGMTKTVDEWGNTTYTDENGSNIQHYGEMRNGMFEVEIKDENGNVSYSVFNIRTILETPLTDMFREGTMPRITYHFSDIEFAGYTADGDPIFAMSLYDYWNNGTTNELYLYVPGHETDQMDYETREYIRTPDRLFDLGDTGEHNIIASIHSAEVTGGLDSKTEDGANALAANVYVAR